MTGKRIMVVLALWLTGVMPSPAGADGHSGGLVVERASLAPSPDDPELLVLALLGTREGSREPGEQSLVVRTLDRGRGFQVGEDLTYPTDPCAMPAADVRISTVIDPGTVMVLCEDGTVEALRLDTKGGTPRVSGSYELAIPTGGMAAYRLAEMPNPDDPTQQILAAGLKVGPSRGGVAGVRVEEFTGGVFVAGKPFLIDLGGRVRDLEVVSATLPSGAAFVFTALVGDEAVLVHLARDPRGGDLTPVVAGRLRDGRRSAQHPPPDDGTPGGDQHPPPDDTVPPLWDLAAPPLGPKSLPAEGAVAVAGANGTADLTTYTLPGIVDGTSNALAVRGVQALRFPVRQVVLGSVTLLFADGSGVAYDRRFTAEEGVTRTLWTLAGAAAEVDPPALNPSSQGRWVTARIEVASGGAAAIDPATLMLEVAGVSIPASPRPTPKLIAHDGDANPDLEAKFDRQAVIAAAQRSGAAVSSVTLRWRTHAGGDGSATALLSVPAG